MRNISFFLTQQQIRDRTKIVTRRIGCFSDYIQSKRCYPAGPFDVKSQVTTARIASSPSLCWQSLTPTGRMSAPRTAPS